MRRPESPRVCLQWLLTRPMTINYAKNWFLSGVATLHVTCDMTVQGLGRKNLSQALGALGAPARKICLFSVVSKMISMLSFYNPTDVTHINTHIHRMKRLYPSCPIARRDACSLSVKCTSLKCFGGRHSPVSRHPSAHRDVWGSGQLGTGYWTWSPTPAVPPPPLPTPATLAGRAATQVRG